ncbi:MAG: hypothetical protein ACLS8R_05210 [Anaeromassilibacillus sp.]
MANDGCGYRDAPAVHLGDLELTEDQMALMDYDGNGTADIRDMIQWKKVLLTQA